ncbi:MAG: cytochrome P450 [Sandaracinus sp.]|nr:cytochrome P450 [Myxococcales bacterium]MCB9600258.1 cytochrome P450 [Sandaracinus sp.]MCB9612704.1 cytochrome P450 [Sandaracinus sp.]MCB9633857.1 cytochrome P450 [Sandaracinus sp.]
MDLVTTVADRAARRLVRWEQQTPDALPPGPLAPQKAQMFSFLLTPGPFLRACRERFGKVVTIRIPGIPPIVQFSEPDAVREVFAANDETVHAGEANAVLEPFLGSYSVLILDGPRHRSQRRLLLPPFRGDRMRAYGEAMRDITEAAVAKWPRAPGGGERFVLQRETQAITLDVILRTVFGMEDGADQDRMRALLVRGLRILDNPFYLVRTFQKDLGPLSPWGRFLRLREAMFHEMDALVERRRREGFGDDILSMLLQATHEDGAPMSNAEIHDELLTLLVAGHETTATGLTWALHDLSIHPQVLRRVQEELDARLGGGPIDPDKVRELPYLDAVCKETLRLHPVIPGIGRVLQKPTRVGGIDLPAGVAIGCSIYLVHSDPDTWPEPERYDPTRFLDKKPTPYTYFPFGGGIRRCIGEAFALYEMRIVLATILQKLEPVATVKHVREQRRNITLTPAGGLPIRMQPR